MGCRTPPTSGAPPVAAVAALVLALVLVSVPSAVAAPADPHSYRDVRLPSGKAIRLHGFGDEYGNGLQTAGGYTVVRDRRRHAWEYARKAPGGRLVPSGRVAGEDPPLRTSRGLRDSSLPLPAPAPPPPASAPAAPPPGGSLRTPTFPSLGTGRSLVILAQFANQSSRGT